MNCTQSLTSSTSIYHPIYTLSHMHAINCRYFLSSGRIYNQPCYIQSYRRVDVDRNTDLQPNLNSDEDHTDWSIKFICSIPQPGGTIIPTFITRQHQSAPQRTFTTTADPHHLQGKQLQAYTLVQQHLEAEDSSPLYKIVSGTAGTG